MSDDTGTFLARWSKRKSQARSATDVEDVPGTETGYAAKALDVRESAIPPADDPEEIPLEELPPIESIDASTDLAPWLKKKVPQAWRQAALRRVWAADPAISQFVGLADYAWDWNTPGGVPGSGPLRATDNVAQLLAQAIGQMRKKENPEREVTTDVSEAPAADAAAAENVESAAALPKERSAETALGPEPTLEERAGGESQPTESSTKSPVGYDHKVVRKRRGGGALPG